jgi:hypothetical protein
MEDIAVPFDVWCTMLTHVNNNDLHVVSGICRCAHNAVRTDPLKSKQLRAPKNVDTKVEVLYRLWVRAKPASFFSTLLLLPPPFDDIAAREAVKGYIDYFQGRMIKADFSQFVEGNVDLFDAYDTAFGKGRARKALGW